MHAVGQAPSCCLVLLRERVSSACGFTLPSGGAKQLTEHAQQAVMLQVGAQAGQGSPVLHCKGRQAVTSGGSQCHTR